MPPVPNQPSFDDPELRFSSSLVFFVNGKKVLTCLMQLMSNEKVVFLPQTIVKPTTCQVIEENPDPATTLLTFLR